MIRSIVLSVCIGLILIFLTGCAEEAAPTAPSASTNTPAHMHRAPSMEY
jgi:hypothetical protein